MAQPRFHGVFGSLLSNKVDVAPEKQQSQSFGSGMGDDTFFGEDAEEVVEQSSSASVGQIALDIYQEGDYLVIKAPIAGVKLADLDIDIAGNVITIRGERTQTDEDIADDQYFVQECYWGSFERSVTLPFAINASKIKATFNKDNVLKIFVQREKRVKIVRINEGG